MARVEKKQQTKGTLPQKAAVRSHLITSMLDTFIRGKEKGDPAPRAARLVESLYYLAMSAANEGVRLAATKEILDRIDGKVVERREIKSVKIEGIVYIPSADEVSPEYLN
jgi:hypothetical protein